LDLSRDDFAQLVNVRRGHTLLFFDSTTVSTAVNPGCALDSMASPSSSGVKNVRDSVCTVGTGGLFTPNRNRKSAPAGNVATYTCPMATPGGTMMLSTRAVVKSSVKTRSGDCTWL